MNSVDCIDMFYDDKSNLREGVRMLEFDIYQILLIVSGVIVLTIFFIHDKRTWVEFYGGAQANLDKTYQVYSYLKANGVKCRVKNRNQPISRMQTSQSATAVIEIAKGEEYKANNLLAEFRRKNSNLSDNF